MGGRHGGTTVVTVTVTGSAAADTVIRVVGGGNVRVEIDEPLATVVVTGPDLRPVPPAAVPAAAPARPLEAAPVPLVSPATAAALRRLSRRERETLAYIGAGYTHQQTATRMAISTATVNTFVSRIRTKLGVGNKAELTQLAVALRAQQEDIPADWPGSDHHTAVRRHA
ncbi:MAG: helix-turn-helix transcriptional regulator [Mycobacteriales bacterium]